jgi:hypothetical protein
MYAELSHPLRRGAAARRGDGPVVDGHGRRVAVLRGNQRNLGELLTVFRAVDRNWASHRYHPVLYSLSMYTELSHPLRRAAAARRGDGPVLDGHGRRLAVHRGNHRNLRYELLTVIRALHRYHPLMI